MTDPERGVGTSDRRAFLRVAGGMGVASLAGCLSGDDGGGESTPTDAGAGTTRPPGTSPAGTSPPGTAPPTTAPPIPKLPETFETTDGFETGDYRNFAPLYVGDESDWIRPRATITAENPIAGEHSLRWQANENPQQWALVNNGVQLNPPVTASTSIRIDGRSGEAYAAGIAIAESQTEAAVVRTTATGFELATDTWDGDPVDTAGEPLPLSRPYELSIELDGTTVTGVLRDDGGSEVAQVAAAADIDPNAVALYVDTAAGATTTMIFDDVSVTGGPYRVRNGEWTRAHPFVVLPRQPDVGQDQGNWVGGQDVIDEGDRYRMWYRIRTNESRGKGFGLAESEDGYEWGKSGKNPILVPDYGQSSMEGITVLNVDDTYHAWYTINQGGTWKTVHATSDDGIDWTDRGVVIEGIAKDPMAVHVDGTFYLYDIGPSSYQEFGVYTSPDGQDWTHENTIDLNGRHSHPEAYYVRETETFWLYAFAEESTSLDRPARVRRASSENGIDFGELAPTWEDPPLGIDHRPPGGIDYGSFLTDEHGQFAHDRRLPVYYQSRHNYGNNRPGWAFAGDGVVTLAGQFSGLFEGVPTTVDGEAYDYHAFPLDAPSIGGLDVEATDPATVTVETWTPDEDTAATGILRADDGTTLTVSASGLAADSEYVFSAGEATATATTDADGAATIEVTIPPGTATAFELAGQ
jgi:hypothetical protein